jgi:putative hydrolase of the HAD superfamily
VITAVTLDFWGTLLFDSPAADERYKRERLTRIATLLDAAGFGVSPAQLERAYGESGRALARRWRTLRDMRVEEHILALLRALDPTLPDRCSRDLLAALVAAYATPSLVVPPTFDDTAPEALRALRARGLAIGLVCNTLRTPGRVLRQVLAREGLLEAFSVLTFSDECGIRKPDPAIFHLTLRALGAAPREAVHVGDDAVLDVEGARAAGMRVIQVGTDGGEPDPAAPDAIITRLGELPAALAALEPSGVPEPALAGGRGL